MTKSTFSRIGRAPLRLIRTLFQAKPPAKTLKELQQTVFEYDRIDMHNPNLFSHFSTEKV